MKLKYSFVVREIGGNPVAVAVGQDNAKFHGMVKMNHSGAFIFGMLQDGVKDAEEIIEAVMKEYDVSEENAKPLVMDFVEQMRQGDLLIG